MFTYSSFLDIFQFNKTLITFSFSLLFFLYGARLKNFDLFKKQSLHYISEVE